ncbi:MAG: FAD-dependent thymidylate synthase [Patescibacteria group bacterium]
MEITPKVEIISYTQNPEQVIAAAIRQCYSRAGALDLKKKTDEKTRARLISQIIKSGHHSTIEHASFTFAIEGVSRALTHQLVRHRVASFCVDGDAVTETYISASRHTKRRTISELFKMKTTSHGRGRLKLVKIKCMNPADGTITHGKISDVIYSGKKTVIEIFLSDGKRIKATKDHLFYTQKGWMRLEDALMTKAKIAVNGLPVTQVKELHDCKWLTREYLYKNRMILDIAAELGVAEITVRKYIRKHGIRKLKKDYPNRKPGHGKKGMFSSEVLKILSEQKQGSKNPQWKGGVTSRDVVLRKMVSKEQRMSIYKRDGYSCRLCKKVGGRLTLHHVKPLYDNGHVVDSNNLVTLCWPCHCKVNNYEPDFAKNFNILDPIPYRPKIQNARNKWIVHFVDITSSRLAGEKNTYDIIMAGPHHNFLANGVIVHNSQQSQRYVRAEDFNYTIPPKIKIKKEAQEIFEKQIKEAAAAYKKLVGLGIDKEDARFLLPNAAETKIVVTMNARELLHFFQLRLCNRAQWEIRVLAYKMLEKVKPLAPNIFKYAGPTCETEKICWEGKLACPKWKVIGAELRERGK